MTDPDPAEPRRRRPPPPSGPDYRPPPRELTLLALGIALTELALMAADRGIVFDPSLRSRLYTVGAFWAPLLHGAEPIFAAQPWTMFITHGLLHGGFLHMAMNMAVLLGLGRFVADRYGAGAILPTFVAGAMAGGLAFGLISPSPLPMVGASGAVFAFLGVWTVWDWRRLRERRMPIRPVLTRIATLALLNLVFFVGLSGMLAWEAHLGGFLAGVAAGLILESRRTARLRDGRPGA